MKRIEFEGQTHEFPDDFNDADISKALGSKAPAPASQPSMVDNATQWVQDLPRNFVTRKMEPYAPSAATAATMAIPGLGFLPAAARTVTAGLGRAAETAYDQNQRQDYSGPSPLNVGVKSGLIQGAAEAVAPVANKGLEALWNLVPGVRATKAVEKLAESMTKANATPAPVPGEYMGKFAPTGIPASKILGPNGLPVSPAVAPQVIPHKDLVGWSMVDVLNQAAKSGADPRYWTDKTAALMRLLGVGAAASQESQ